MPPIVGIPQCLDDRGRWRTARDYVYLDHAYARAVDEAGGVALHLPLQSRAEALVSGIDALLIPGGDDFLPADPTGYPEGVFDPAPRSQVDFDLRLLRAALGRGIPVLGICYGMQLVALHHGGSLHHHLPHDRPDAGDHRLPEETGRHAIHVEAGTRLAEILGDPPPPVNSIHHQAVAEPGPGLRVSARSPDGIVEAIEAEDGRFVLGVQWHPEKSDDGGRAALFGAFVSAAA